MRTIIKASFPCPVIIFVEGIFSIEVVERCFTEKSFVFFICFREVDFPITLTFRSVGIHCPFRLLFEPRWTNISSWATYSRSFWREKTMRYFIYFLPSLRIFHSRSPSSTWWIGYLLDRQQIPRFIRIKILNVAHKSFGMSFTRCCLLNYFWAQGLTQQLSLIQLIILMMNQVNFDSIPLRRRSGF